MDSCEALDALLEAAGKGQKIVECDGFSKALDESQKQAAASRLQQQQSSVVHSGETDSSDDEELRNSSSRKYLDAGLALKRSSVVYSQLTEQTAPRNFWAKPKAAAGRQAEKGALPGDVYTDPVFGLRLVKPLVSSAVLKEKMLGRTAVPISRLQGQLAKLSPESDWVVAGVIVQKGIPKTSQKGSQFSVWTLSDLKDDLKTVSMFLFGAAFKELWKVALGSAVGVLNPNILDNKEGSKDVAALSVDHPQKVMLLGTSKDYGLCRSKKKNGDPCGAFVNLGRCEYCLFHVKQEYKKCSNQRPDLQGTLRARVLGKDGVYYGGKLYTNEKIREKDSKRLQILSGALKADAKCDKVCKKFDEKGGQALNRGFLVLSREHAVILKAVKSNLPRRESERFNHPLSRLHNLLSCIETRITSLNMTYMRYIKRKLCCFIPGKVLDELGSILRACKYADVHWPTSMAVLKELKDVTGMALDHFDEHIVPHFKNKLILGNNLPKGMAEAGCSTSSGLFISSGLISTSGLISGDHLHHQPSTTQTLLPQELIRLHHEGRKCKRELIALRKSLFKMKRMVRLHAIQLCQQSVRIRRQNIRIERQRQYISDLRKKTEQIDVKFRQRLGTVAEASGALGNMYGKKLICLPPPGLEMGGVSAARITPGSASAGHPDTLAAFSNMHPLADDVWAHMLRVRCRRALGRKYRLPTNDSD